MNRGVEAHVSQSYHKRRTHLAGTSSLFLRRCRYFLAGVESAMRTKPRVARVEEELGVGKITRRIEAAVAHPGHQREVDLRIVEGDHQVRNAVAGPTSVSLVASTTRERHRVVR